MADEPDLRTRLRHVVPVHVLLHGQPLSLLLVALKYRDDNSYLEALFYIFQTDDEHLMA